MTRIGAFAVATVVFAMTIAGGARADDEQAERAFQEGRALLADGNYREACQAFEKSQKADPASGTLLALAYCQELSGLLASAWTNYRAAAELAQREGQKERHEAATDQSRALAERLSVLTIAVPSSVAERPDLRVTLDGVEVSRASFDTPIPVNGGTYRVAASLPLAAWSATVTLQAERDKKTVVVELTAAPAALERSRVAERRTEAEPASGRSKALEHVGLGLAIGSAAMLVAGVTFGLVASNKNQASNRDGHCDETGCDARGIELRNDAFAAATASTWSFITSGVLALGSAGVYLGANLGADGSTSKQSRRHRNGGTVVITGAF